MVTKLLVRTGLWLVVMAALLFGAAGTTLWPGAWVFLAEMGSLGLGVGLWLARYDPDLLTERIGPLVQKDGQKPWDKAFMVAIVVLWCGWMVLMALDAQRWHRSHLPVWLQGIGALGLFLSVYVAYLVFRENPFAAPVVKIQRHRGHRVVTSGLYRYVRHPMYAGALLFFLGTPLLLGSWAGLAVSPVLIAALMLRTVLEERTLRADLAGYDAYAARVRWRLIPGVW